jgi:organic hydroperoxide reductase OsmC/OhrA
MRREHEYQVEVTWTGNRGEGTSSYRAYGREHEVSGPGKPPLPGSAEPAFRGDADRYNPEELLVAALSQCHMLWYLHLCASAGVVVTAYRDRPRGTMLLDDEGSGAFTEVVLAPQVTVAAAAMADEAARLHDDAARLCFIARSVAFPVRHDPTVSVVGGSTTS